MLSYASLSIRCPEILDAMPGCTYVTDPRDPTCCRVPDCRPTNSTPGPNPSPNPIPPKVYQGQVVNSLGKFTSTLPLTQPLTQPNPNKSLPRPGRQLIR